MSYKKASEKQQQLSAAERSEQEGREKQKCMDREAERRKRLDEREKLLVEQEKNTSRDQEVAQKLLDEATQSLNEALEDRDLLRVQVARDMLQTAKANLEKAIKQKKRKSKVAAKVCHQKKKCFGEAGGKRKKEKTMTKTFFFFIFFTSLSKAFFLCPLSLASSSPDDNTPYPLPAPPSISLLVLPVPIRHQFPKQLINYPNHHHFF